MCLLGIDIQLLSLSILVKSPENALCCPIPWSFSFFFFFFFENLFFGFFFMLCVHLGGLILP